MLILSIVTVYVVGYVPLKTVYPSPWLPIVKSSNPLPVNITDDCVPRSSPTLKSVSDFWNLLSAKNEPDWFICIWLSEPAGEPPLPFIFTFPEASASILFTVFTKYFP